MAPPPLSQIRYIFSSFAHYQFGATPSIFDISQRSLPSYVLAKFRRLSSAPYPSPPSYLRIDVRPKHSKISRRGLNISLPIDLDHVPSRHTPDLYLRLQGSRAEPLNRLDPPGSECSVTGQLVVCLIRDDPPETELPMEGSCSPSTRSSQC
ncbi:hypothetical protein OF83DRAFT_1172570 [Amylostereum chailletii]|nr:hypothetical protein OF83DRAFT_1172570 [Amylostereum chailletii]